MQWWAWICFGLMVIGVELFGVDVAFYLVFIGAAALITGLTSLAGISLTPTIQWLLFATLSILLMVFFRKRLYRMMSGAAVTYREGAAGDSIELNEALAVGETCRVTHQGTTWLAKNSGLSDIAKGQRAVVQGVEGLKLLVSADPK